MPIQFEDVCDLLDSLESLESKQPPLLPGDKSDRLRCTTQAWFNRRRHSLDRIEAEAAEALLSTLLPERRPDRVYGLQATLLSRVLSRGLSLGNAQSNALQAYRQPGRGDLGLCLQRVIERNGPPALPKVSTSEVDGLMTWLAGQCRFSNPKVQAIAAPSRESREDKIGHVVKRLSGRDAKWLVRLMLKDFSPVTIDERLVLKSMHFLLPDLLRFQHDIPAAVGALRTVFKSYPSAPDPASERLLALNASSMLKPQVGVKVDRPVFAKARSIQHCLDMLSQQAWVIERKYDGEYCEIHIDLSLSTDPVKCIKIFSKNGKDATQDRKGIIPTIVSCLALGRSSCKIKKQAILLGELVVWSDTTGNVMPFEEIRKHVTRSGSFLGTRHDCLPTQREHLCIIFFDVLLLDDTLVLNASVEHRRQVLKKIYTKRPGWAKSAEWKVIDFGLGDISKRRLMEQFAASNAMACEGLVLKPCGVPYFSLARDEFHHFIKLKKDYIAGLGDEADFAVVGGSYVAQDASTLSMPTLRWTHFHLGAMVNKDLVLRFQHRPVYKMVATIGPDMCIPRPVLQAANRLGITLATGTTDQNIPPEFDIEPGSSIKVDTTFRQPIVFEVLGSGFVKPSNCDFLMLRHPRVKKLHQDRSWKDCIGFKELQDLASQARTTGIESESQENRHELARLEKSMKKRFDRLSKTPSPTKRIAPRATTAPSATPPRQALGEININTAPTITQRTPPPARLETEPNMSSPPPKRRKVDRSPSPSEEAAVCQLTSNDQQTGAAPSTSMQKTDAAPLTSTQQTSVQPTDQSSPVGELDWQWLDQLFEQHNASKRLGDMQRTCVNEECAMSATVVYFAPSAAHVQAISNDLLYRHSTGTVSCWSHWMRDSTKYDSSTVGESQAYIGCQRIIFVDSRRMNSVIALICELVDKKDFGKVDMEIWDWRLLERIKDHAVSLQPFAAELKLGQIVWSDEVGAMKYEPNVLHQ